MAIMAKGNMALSTANLKVNIGDNDQQVILDGVDISKYVVGVGIHTREGSISTANLELSTNTEFESDKIKFIAKFTDGGWALVNNMDCAVLRLRSGDSIILRCKERLSENAIECLKRYLKPNFPDNPIIILDNDASLSIVRKEGANGNNGQD